MLLLFLLFFVVVVVVVVVAVVVVAVVVVVLRRRERPLRYNIHNKSCRVLAPNHPSAGRYLFRSVALYLQEEAARERTEERKRRQALFLHKKRKPRNIERKARLTVPSTITKTVTEIHC